MSKQPRRSHLREGSGTDNRVSPIELFFDLVFVFAVTQLSHYLLGHHDLMGVLQTLVMFLAIWWAWMFTAWATNWLDPGRAPVRLALLVIMLLSLALSTAIPTAFGAGGLVFACAYVAIQLGRTLYTAWAKQEWQSGTPINLTRASLYFLAAAPLWIVGALDPDPHRRLWWWAGALAIEYSGPVLFFAIPGLGRSRAEEWDISGEHMAERCGLFIIIALGEGVLVTGATFARLDKNAATILALLIAFAGSVAMWWIYFDVGARRGQDVIEHQAHPGLLGREAYTYGHIPIVAGIIVLAVADEMLLAHPTGRLDLALLAVVVAGGLLFVGGAAVFKRLTNQTGLWPLSHLVGLALFVLLGAWGWAARPQPLLFAGAGAGVFVVVALWEWGSFHGGWIDRWKRLAGARS
jgi:low temperature requirement protein LtrA